MDLTGMIQYYDRRTVPPGVEMITRRHRRWNARRLHNKGRRFSLRVAVAIDWAKAT